MMYVRKEAVDSSQIEGTQASLTDLLEYEAHPKRSSAPADVREVVNYVTAMDYGLERLSELPLSTRLIREIHRRLMHNVRGGQRNPGEFRVSQNRIGTGGPLSQAVFVPPPPQEVPRAMSNLERFLHDEAPMQALVKCGLAHAQFETIHPFLDGNGRIGRLLITFLLCWHGVLKQPLLFISDYFSRNRQEYYERLQSVRDTGDWESWIKFFLQAVKTVSLEATKTAGLVQLMRDQHRSLVGREMPSTAAGLTLLDKLFEKPFLKVADVAPIIGRSYTTANQLVASFEKLGLLHEVTGASRNRIYAYSPYFQLFERPAGNVASELGGQAT